MRDILEQNAQEREGMEAIKGIRGDVGRLLVTYCGVACIRSRGNEKAKDIQIT